MREIQDIQMSPFSLFSTVEQKLDVAREAYVRESMSMFPSAVEAAKFAQPLVAVTLKPDAILGSKVPVILKFLEDNEFRIRAARIHRHTRCQIRELWRYQWNVATLDRLALMERLMCEWTSIWLLVEDRQPSKSVPAATRFRALKGSAVPADQKPGQLRTLLAGGNRTMTFVHAADEPFDVLREIGILFDSRERRSVLRDVYARLPSETLHLQVAESARELNTCVPRGSALDLDHAMDVCEELLSGRACNCLSILRDGRLTGHLRFASVDRCGCIDAEPELKWAALVLASEYVVHDIENTVCDIDEDGVSGWREGRGVLAPNIEEKK